MSDDDVTPLLHGTDDGIDPEIEPEPIFPDDYHACCRCKRLFADLPLMLFSVDGATGETTDAWAYCTACFAAITGTTITPGDEHILTPTPAQALAFGRYQGHDLADYEPVVLAAGVISGVSVARCQTPSCRCALLRRGETVADAGALVQTCPSQRTATAPEEVRLR